MNVAEFTLLIACGSFLAGFLGALTGLGGGVVLVPLLALIFKVDIRYAVGASLVSVIATSSGAAAAYVKEGFTNMRIGMFLEIATTVGAISGAFIATAVSTSAIAIAPTPPPATPLQSYRDKLRKGSVLLRVVADLQRNETNLSQSTKRWLVAGTE